MRVRKRRSFQARHFEVVCFNPVEVVLQELANMSLPF